MVLFTKHISFYIAFVAYLIKQICCLYHGADMVGVGYNVLYGNPDGGVSARGGSDPGILTTKHVFELTKLADGTIKELSVSNFTCANISARPVLIYSLVSYRDSLFEDVLISPDTPDNLKNAAFSLSGHFKEVYAATQNNTNVFVDKGAECRLGTMTYKTDLAAADHYSITRHFAAAACDLPVTYNATVYANFIDQWGTHIVEEVFVGIKQIRRYIMNTAELIKHIQFYDPHLLHGTQTSIIVDAKAYTGSRAAGFTVGTLHYSISTGSYSTPEPIGVKLVPISEALKDKYWKNSSIYENIPSCESIHSHAPTIMVNIERALAEYSSIKAAPSVIDTDFALPLVWPSGTYGLPMAKNGCPTGGVTWFTGWIYQDSENNNNDNFWSPNAETLLTVGLSLDGVKTEFCSVTPDSRSSGYGIDWPEGTYCINEYSRCPTGFTFGSLTWDDENDNNGNTWGGNLPSLTINHQYTEVDYCCRSDGVPTKEIFLPTEKDFVLYRYGSDCQQVANMRVESIYVCIDNEDDRNSNGDQVNGHTPSTTGEKTCDGIALNYCHYSRNDFGMIIG